MDDDDPTGHLARVTARIAPDQTGEIVVGLGNRTETYLAGSARGETMVVNGLRDLVADQATSGDSPAAETA